MTFANWWEGIFLAKEHWVLYSFGQGRVFESEFVILRGTVCNNETPKDKKGHAVICLVWAVMFTSKSEPGCMWNAPGSPANFPFCLQLDFWHPSCTESCLFSNLTSYLPKCSYTNWYNSDLLVQIKSWIFSLLFSSIAFYFPPGSK